MRKRLRADFKVLEPCTGTGCITLLLCHLIGDKIPNLSFKATDLHSPALDLARKNLARIRAFSPNVRASRIVMQCRNALRVRPVESEANVVICNPPYVSTQAHKQITSQSVRQYEPISALVPCHPLAHGNSTCRLPAEKVLSEVDNGDHLMFYKVLLQNFKRRREEILLMEIGDDEQALEVVALAYQLVSGLFEEIEIWHDDILEHPNRTGVIEAPIGYQPSSYVKYGGLNGSSARAVVLWRDRGRQWLGRDHIDAESLTKRRDIDAERPPL